MSKLFIENDSELDFSRVKYYLKDLFNYDGEPKDFFDETICDATFNQMECWEAVKNADEIFAETSLIDNMGIDGGMLFNNMMYQCIEENISNKKLYFFTSKKDVWWSNLREHLLREVFKNNELYTIENNKFEKADIEEIINLY